jgi:hypothetical protein
MGRPIQRPTTWSHTRAETLLRCPRRYYYAFIAAPRGRARSACERDRDAFVLSRLTSLELEIGAAVHARAREVARALTRQAPMPTADQLLDRCRGELNRLWRASGDIRAFLDAPEQRVAFAEVLYERPPGPSRLGRLRERLWNCILALVEHPVWEEVRALPRNATRVVDRPIRLETPDVTYWGAPDLVISGPAERTVVLDWKTGRDETEMVARQLSTYAWLIRDALRPIPPPQGMVAKAVFLVSGTEMVRTLEANEIDAARVRAENEAAVMRAAQDDEIATFPLATSRQLCPRCPFWGLCEAEISRRKAVTCTVDATHSDRQAAAAGVSAPASVYSPTVAEHVSGETCATED